MSIKTIGWPEHSDDERHAVNQVLMTGCTNYWTGNECRSFEKEFADYIGTKYAVALMNGTVALEAALYALEIGKGDEVITSCRTFIASASCIVMRGATPVLADVDQNTQNISVETIEPLITKKTKAIIVVHLAGYPADMEAILSLADKYHLKVIEDCAQAHGAAIKGRKVGSFGDIAAFSFCQDKIMTTGGEGGMVTTNHEEYWRKIWSFKDHGKNYEKVYQPQEATGFRFLHDSFGTNWRMTEIQAAIGRVQLRKLDNWLAIRKRNAEILLQKLSAVKALRIPTPPTEVKHAYYKFYVFIIPDELKPEWNRDRILAAINEQGVACYTGSCSEIYLENAFRDAGLQIVATKPTAKKLGETSLMFLVHPTLAEETVKKAAETILAVMQKASK